MATAAAPVFSVVVPVYNEAGNILPLLDEIARVLHDFGETFEIIVVNDGSRDATLAELRSVVTRIPGLRILDLEGNYGEAAALCAGFRAAHGVLVITLDGDGQNDPHDIPPLVRALRRNDCRVVSGWRQERREDRLLRVWPSRLANRLIAMVTGIPTHDNGCGLKVYHRTLVGGAALPPGMNRFLPAILGVTARDVAEVPVRDRHRQHGRSHYGISRALVVLRDLLALRFILRNPRASEPVAARAALAAMLAAGAALWYRSAAVALLAVPAGVVGGMVWWNLRRFNRAQREGVSRVRREYSTSSAAEAEKEAVGVCSR
jgi:glycosyltransferase involved in cell wall biosynthesis